MRKYKASVSSRPGLQDRTVSEFMSVPTILPLPYYEVGMQTHEYSPQIVGSEPKLDFSATANLRLSWLDGAERQLREIRLEAEEARELDSETEVVPESAYSEARFLLFLLNAPHFAIPMPDIIWLEDGGIGFEWRAKNGHGIGTMSLYGDNQVIYGASLGSTRRVKGTCALSNLTSLGHFFMALFVLCS